MHGVCKRDLNKKLIMKTIISEVKHKWTSINNNLYVSKEMSFEIEGIVVGSI